MFATNKGTNVLPLTMDGRPLTGGEGQNGLFASATLDKDANQIVVKVANTSKEDQTLNIDITGLKKGKALDGGKVLTLHADLEAENTLDNPDIVKPVEWAEYRSRRARVHRHRRSVDVRRLPPEHQISNWSKLF